MSYPTGPPPGYLHQNKQFIGFLLPNGDFKPTAKLYRLVQPIRSKIVGVEPISDKQFMNKLFSPHLHAVWVLGVTKHFIIVLNINCILTGSHFFRIQFIRIVFKPFAVTHLGVNYNLT